MFDLERNNQCMIVRMQHPPANALDDVFCTSLIDCINAEIEADSKAIILTGQGSIFSAGVDLVKLTEGGSDYVHEFLEKLEQLCETLFFCPKPVVAAINGHAIAGGCVIASCADYRIMVHGKGKIGLPELRVGVPFPAIIMELIRAKVHYGCFEQIILGGAIYDPGQAQQRGLIDEIVEAEELLNVSQATAESLAEIRPDLYALSKLQARQPVRDRIAATGMHHTEQINAFWKSKQTRQAIQDYMMKTFKK